VLSLRQVPEQRLDLSALLPHRLAGRSAAEIAAIELQTARPRVTAGDVFRLRMGDAQHVVIEGACDRLDRIGEGMSAGEMTVEGEVGARAGRLMTGGQLTIIGSAGPWAASAMTGGRIEITGSAGDRLGGPVAGETAGMRGGLVVVRRDAGARAGDRMRRGLILVEGHAGPYAGCRMIAGTLAVRRSAGPLPGYLMRRGTILLGGGCDTLSPTFVDCGRQDLVALRLMANVIAVHSASLASVIRRTRQRLAGDMAVLGKGEIFMIS